MSALPEELKPPPCWPSDCPVELEPCSSSPLPVDVREYPAPESAPAPTPERVEELRLVAELTIRASLELAETLEAA